MALKAKNKKKYSLGIVIRTWNEAEFLGKCLDVLKKQRMDLIKSMHILVIDSYSTDGTIEIAENEGCTLIQIPKKDFSYGGSLNTGFEALKTDLIVCISAHAIPRSNDFLFELVKWFDDPAVAGTYVKQDAWQDALFTEKVRIYRTFNGKPRTFTQPDDPDMHFSNVASCIRRSMWKKKPFHAIPSSEDYFWAEAMLKSGYKIIYNPAAAVFHSHKDTCAEFARRVYNILRNELVTKKRKPLNEILVVIYHGLSHIKVSLKICLTEKGFLADKLIVIGRLPVEFMLLIYNHFKSQ